MSLLEREEKVRAAITAWDGALAALHAAAEAYRVQHATIYLQATGADALRKAAADAATTAPRTERDRCEREERCRYHAMIFLRGSAGEAERVS